LDIAFWLLETYVVKEGAMSNVEQPPVDPLQELVALRQRIAELEATETRYMQVQKELQASKEQLAIILEPV